MTPTPSHEIPIYVELPVGADTGAEIVRFLDDPRVRHYALPPMWQFERVGFDMGSAMPEVASLTRENLPRFLEDLTLLCDAQALDRFVHRLWHDVEESVRDHYLQRGTLETMASIFKMGPKSTQLAPPPQFRIDRIHDNGFEVQYRLAPDAAVSEAGETPEEGSLMYYPFDPANAAGRSEGGVGEGSGAVIEAFAYDVARDQHRDLLTSVGAGAGWRVVDPLAS